MLHNHSAYSIIDGRATIDQYLDLVQQDKQKFFALTDHGTIGGAIDLYQQAKKRGIKPVLGCELYVDAVELKERNYPGHLTVLARNEAGYRALIAANNLAHRQFYYRPRLTLRQIIDNRFAENWIVLSGCMSSPFYDFPQSESELMIKQLAAHSGRFFIEVMYHKVKNEAFEAKQEMYLERAIAYHKSTGIPFAVTNDCHYAHKHQEDKHQEFLAISKEAGGLEFDGLGFNFRSLEFMQKSCDILGYKDALDNSVSAAMECDLVIPEADTLSWYVPDITNGQPYQTVRAIAEQRLQGMSKEYRDRFEYEMGVIATSSAILNSYLVAHDIVQWCAGRNIPVAARGSMAGSLVSHLLGITLEDPVRYNLKFERAVNPARPTIPDFDLDVSSSHRSEILDYLKTRYEHNIPICSYTKYGPKGALRKILRMEGLRDQVTVNNIVKDMPDDWPDENLPEWCEDLQHYEYPVAVRGEMQAMTPGSRKRGSHYPDNWFYSVPEPLRDVLMTHKGINSSLSVHPSGIMVAGPERNPEHEVPLQWIASSSTLASAYDMYTLKKLGLFKLDVLGLNTLDQLESMERFSGIKAPMHDYSDPDVIAAFSANLLSEIFQMDGHTCREVIRQIGGINNFEDIVAVNTLARPGAGQFVSYYRTGLKDLVQEYPQLQPVLGYTNGLILYQEQVMEIGKVLADFNDAEQDDIKEAIKYFRHEEFQKTIAPLFLQRCLPKGIDPTNILQRIMEFSKYTFNRAHAMTYSAIAYRQMWYKIYYPAAFYASVFDSSEDRRRLLLESHFFNVKWCPPDVNESGYRTSVKDNKILLGLGAIKGIGVEAFRALDKARPFASTEDLEKRVEKRKANSKVRNALQVSCALESLGEKGNVASFQDFYGFPYSYLDGGSIRQLEAWENDDPATRLAGYVTNIYEREIKSGTNAGRMMANIRILNSVRGERKAVIFADLWRKAKTALYVNAPVMLEGKWPTEGDFYVEHGHAI